MRKSSGKNKKSGGSNRPSGPRRVNYGSSTLGRLVEKGVTVAKSIPVIGDVVSTVESVASSILGFLGGESANYEVHYGLDGRQRVRLHRHLQDKGLSFSSTGTGESGAILMKYVVSIGPEGSRSRIQGQLFEKVKYKQVQVEVLPTCASTEPGQLAYVFVPDVHDVSLENMAPNERVASVLSRENVQVSQIWQAVTLRIPVQQQQFYVRVEDGDERLCSPGIIYVIALTDVDPQKLPTLRQSSRLEFSRATLLPQVNQVETYAATRQIVSSVVGDDTTLDCLNAFQALSSAASETKVTNITIGTAVANGATIVRQYLSVPALAVKAGATIRAVGTADMVSTMMVVPLSRIVGANVLGSEDVTWHGNNSELVGGDENLHNFLSEYNVPSDGYLMFSPNGAPMSAPQTVMVTIEPGDASPGGLPTLARALKSRNKALAKSSKASLTSQLPQVQDAKMEAKAVSATTVSQSLEPREDITESKAGNFIHSGAGQSVIPPSPTPSVTLRGTSSLRR